jgi:hypothetical protein
LAAVLVLPTAVAAGLGWLYVLRGLGWFAAGPAVGDSLPLLQLAAFDRQPLLRVVVAWLCTGLVAGVALSEIPRGRRAAAAAALAVVLLLLASQASYALARNLHFGDVLWSRGPGIGPWLEAAVFAGGCALPRPAGKLTIAGSRWVRAATTGLLRHLGVGAGQHRDAQEHRGDRE